MKRLSIFAFSFGSSAVIFSNVFGWTDLPLFAKPLIMIGLMGHYWFNTNNRSTLFLVALFFCWVGDVLLMFQSSHELFFMGGLGAFLTGHVLYILTYQQHRSSEGEGLLGPQRIRFSLPIILAGTGLVVILYPVLGGLKIPVMIYALVITVMTLQALFRFGFTTTSSFVTVFIGAILFMISDSVLAFNKFVGAVPAAGAIIMLTYCVAQFMIVQGILNHANSKLTK